MTRKEQQRVENALTLEALEAYNKLHEKVLKVTRLDYCKAWVLETDNFYMLKSYDTIVAFTAKGTPFIYDVLRYVYGYTATSAKHISKFIHKYGRNKMILQYREV